MGDELSFNSKQRVKLIVEGLQEKSLNEKFKDAQEKIAEMKKQRTIKQLKHIREYGLY